MLKVAELDRILREEDIEGLIALGAPQDEYSSEAEEMNRLLDCLSPDEFNEERIGQVVMRVWDRMFGPFSPEDLEKRSTVLEAVVKQITLSCPK